MEKSILKLGKPIKREEQKKITGGVPREEYCDTLRTILLGGNYQGDISYGMSTFYQHCGSHGIYLW